MTRSVAHLFVLITASSTMLLGMPFLTAASTGGRWVDLSISAAPLAVDATGEVRGENVEEEREQESESKIHLFVGRVAPMVLPVFRTSVADRLLRSVRLNASLPIFSIRGPPVA